MNRLDSVKIQWIYSILEMWKTRGIKKTTKWKYVSYFWGWIMRIKTAIAVDTITKWQRIYANQRIHTQTHTPRRTRRVRFCCCAIFDTIRLCVCEDHPNKCSGCAAHVSAVAVRTSHSGAQCILSVWNFITRWKLIENSSKTFFVLFKRFNSVIWFACECWKCWYAVCHPTALLI